MSQEESVEFLIPKRPEEETTTSTDDVFEVDVFECNIKSVEFYRLCFFHMVAGPTKLIPLGVSLSEITAVLDLHNVPAKKRLKYVEDVRLMSNAAKSYIQSL